MLNKIQETSFMFIDGATGYLGSSAYSFFKSNGYRICGGSRADFKLISPSNVETVLLFAGLHGGSSSDILNVHLHHPESVVKHFSSNPTHFIYASSGSVYGAKLGAPASLETDLVFSHDSYSNAKILAERSLIDLCHRLGHTLTILRLPPLVGPDSNSGVVHSMISQYNLFKKVNIYGDGSYFRDFLALKDLCDVILYIVVNKLPGLFNVTSTASCSMIDLAISITGSYSNLVFHPSDSNLLEQLHLDDSLVRRISSIRPSCATIEDIVKLARA